MRFNKCPVCGGKMEITNFIDRYFSSSGIKEAEMHAKCLYCGADMILSTNKREDIYSKIEEDYKK